MKFSQAIYQLRESMHLSQEAFAKELGVSFTSVNRWENESQTPSPLALKMIKALCEKQGLPFLYDDQKQGE